MIRDIISNDIITVILFSTIFLIVILKKIEPSTFYSNLSFRKKNLESKLVNNLLGFKKIDFLYKILYISNLSILLNFYIINNFDLFTYLEFLKLISSFYLIKIFIELILSRLFNIKKIIKNYIYSKIVYRNSLGLLILFFNFLIIYSNYNQIIPILLLLAIIYLVLSYFFIFFSMKKLIIKNWFYFILYLCTLEIIPYYYFFSNIL
ncbi:MAG: hypothetical protein CMB90_00275 [Flammeovirgaceae bacterium]|nr:hypothetical protein [Flammeovirgaceae bacterium]